LREILLTVQNSPVVLLVVAGGCPERRDWAGGVFAS